MTETVDALLTRHYSAHVLGLEVVSSVLESLQVSALDKDIRAELEARYRAIQAIGLSDQDLSQRDFSCYVEMVALRKILESPITPTEEHP